MDAEMVRPGAEAGATDSSNYIGFAAGNQVEIVLNSRSVSALQDSTARKRMLRG
jgi:hypothetical protein